MATTKKNKKAVEKIVTDQTEQVEEPLSPRGQMRVFVYRDRDLPEGKSPAFDFCDSVDAVQFHMSDFVKCDAHLFTDEQRVVMEQVVTFISERDWKRPRRK